MTTRSPTEILAELRNKVSVLTMTLSEATAQGGDYLLPAEAKQDADAVTPLVLALCNELAAALNARNLP